MDNLSRKFRSAIQTLLLVLPCFLLYGYNQAAIGSVLNFGPFQQQFPQLDTAHTKGHQESENALLAGTVVAIYTIACLIGAAVSPYIANVQGRRKSLALFAIIAAVGSALQGSSYVLAQLIAGRIIAGIGLGGISSVVVVWETEISDAKDRGKNVVVGGIFIAAGIALTGWISFGFSWHQESSLCWRLPLLIPIIFCALICCSALLLPESAPWLIQKGRIEEARYSIAKLRGIKFNAQEVSAEVESIQQQCIIHAAGKRGYLDIFKPGEERLLYRTCLAIVINFCGQMTGANVITYYATAIFEKSLHFEKRQSAILSAVLLTWKIVAACLASYYVDRAGRKALFMTSGVGMGFSMLALSVTASYLDHPGAGPAAVAFLFIFMFFFPLGFLGSNYLYTAEIAPQDLRAHYAAIGTGAHWLFNFVIAEVTPVAFSNIGPRYYIVFTCTGFSVPILVYFLFPETNQGSLDEMDKIFSEPKHWWQVVPGARRLPRGLPRAVPGAVREDIETAEDKDESFDLVEKENQEEGGKKTRE